MPSEDIEDARIHPGMTQEEVRDAEYRALVAGQRLIIKQFSEVSRSTRSMEKRYDKQLDDMRRELEANTLATNSVKTDTKDLVDAINAIKGGMTVLAWLGKLAKPLLYIGVPGAIILAAWHGLEDWVKNFPRHP